MISHDPQDGPTVQFASADSTNPGITADLHSHQGDCVWLELLRDGLTFDLCGLSPGSAQTFPAIDHRFDLSAMPAEAELEALSLRPGHHLAAGATSLPVSRGIIALARDLTHHFSHLVAVVWPPSRSAIGRRYFESVSAAWLEGGAFPALGLTAFQETSDGALESVGLAYWIGEEIRIEPPLAQDKVAATRLGVRLVNQLVLVGGIEGKERVMAPDGTRLVMQVSSDHPLIRVWRE